MKPFFAKLAAVVAVLLAALPALAQQGFPAERKPPHIAFAYPAGGQAGTTFEVTVGGENVYGATAAVISGKGGSVQVTDAAEPESAKDPDKKKQKKKNQTVLDERVKLKVTLAPDAEPGDRELYLVTPGGASNKLVFQVGQLKELAESEPNDRKTPNPLPALPVAINGRIMPGDEDVFRFSAKKGQRLVFEVSARALIPYIADAVPGWFQALVSVRDAQGRELAAADNFRFRQDPVLFFEVPADGDYLFAVRDSIYRGREDFVYRIRAGELPFITDVFPLGARRGDKPASVTLSGWNLPAETMAVTSGPDAPPVRFLTVTRDGLASNPVPFAAGDLPEILADETAGRDKGQDVRPPVVVNGRLGTPGQTHAFRFHGAKGQSVTLEVRARRLGSPLDSRLTLLDDTGKVVAENDDVKDPAQGFLTHPADSELTCTLPADGLYAVRIRDTQGNGGASYAYRLRVSPPQPDFELRATPASCAMARGASAELTVHAIRREGFSGEIRLGLCGDSAGLRLDGAVIPPGADSVRVTLTAPDTTAAAVLHPALAGTAVIDGRGITRPVLPAEQMMQAFIYLHLMPFREQAVAVQDPPALFSAEAELPKTDVLELPAGRESTFNVRVVRQPGFDGPVRFQLVDPPKGVVFRRGFIPPGKNAGTITIRAEAKVAQTLAANLILSASTPIEREATPEERARIEAREAKKTAASAADKPGAAATPGDAKTPPAAKTAEAPDAPKKPLMITRPLTFTMPAVPFKVTEPPKTPQKPAAATPPPAKGNHAAPDRKN